jgi:hypothetical protein
MQWRILRADTAHKKRGTRGGDDSQVRSFRIVGRTIKPIGHSIIRVVELRSNLVEFRSQYVIVAKVLERTQVRHHQDCNTMAMSKVGVGVRSIIEKVAP